MMISLTRHGEQDGKDTAIQYLQQYSDKVPLSIMNLLKPEVLLKLIWKIHLILMPNVITRAQDVA
jgi:hypothetical protein